MASKRFEAQLGLNTKEFDAKLKGSQASVNGFGSAMSAATKALILVGAIRALTSFTKASIEAARKTNELSEAALDTSFNMNRIKGNIEDIKLGLGRIILDSKLWNFWTERLANTLTKIKNVLGKEGELIKIKPISQASLKDQIKSIDKYAETLRAWEEARAKNVGQGLVGPSKDTFPSNIPATFGLHGGTLAPAPKIQEITEALDLQMEAVGELTAAFTDMFFNIDQGFQGMVESLIASIKRLVAELLAKAAVLALLNIIAPGSGVAVAAHKALTGSGLGSLFAGNKMMGNLSTSPIAVGGQFTIKGRDLALTLRRNGMGY
jgi:hypothetical protein